MKRVRTLRSFVAAIFMCGFFFVGCTPANTPPQPEPNEDGFLGYMPYFSIEWVGNDIEDPSKPWFELYDSRCDGDFNDKRIGLSVRRGLLPNLVTVLYNREMIDNSHFRLTEDEVLGVYHYDDWLKIRDQYLSSTWIFSAEYKYGYGIYWRLSDEEGKVPDLVFTSTGEW